ncbi:hypothetical protein C8J31_112113 [Rhizobium sp. PP-CC-2G-626]|nr:hypothetical protein C8J31_112113 [Rhizobium sp. PP-CC-2G-626]
MATRRISAVALLCIPSFLIQLMVFSPMAAASPLTTGAVCTGASPSCNRCISNVADAVNTLRDHGDPMGFSVIGDPVGNAASYHHWQGLQRLSGNGENYLVISRSDNGRGTVPFSLVRMTQPRSIAERWRSNRLSASPYPATAPTNAQMVGDQPMPAYLSNYAHSGGLQSSGNILAVALDGSLSGGMGQVLFYDMSDLANITLLPPRITTMTGEAGSVSLTQLGDGTFLAATARNAANTLEFYRSTASDLGQSGTTFSLVGTWNESALQTTIGDSEFGDYQSLHFITQCDGSLFLAGTHMNTSVVVGIGEDWLDLFRVTDANGQIVLTKVAKKHLYCGYPSPNYGTGANTQCNMDAAGGVFVDATGQLLVYASEHDNSGPGNSVKMMEFRSIFPVPQQKCLTDIQYAWAELYDDSNFSDRGLMIDYADYTLRRYDNLKNVEGFGDKTSAVRWCIPAGWRVRLYDDDGFRDRYKEFTGTGEQNLNAVGFNDKTSSVRFVYVGN